jgi:hypothetical protein
MTKERALCGQFLLSSSDRAERDEKVFRYAIHRIDEDADLHEVLREPYVRCNPAQVEIDEIHANPELVRAAREHMEQTFRSGELNSRRHR